MLEQKIETMTAAVEENTRAILALAAQLEHAVPTAYFSVEVPEEPEAAPEQEAEPETVDQPTAKDVREKLIQVSEAHGRDAVAEILGKFGATKFKELPADNYADAISTAEEALAA